MDHAGARRLIRLKLHDGRLPRTQAVDFWVLPSRGHTCDGCGEPIGPNRPSVSRVASVWGVATREWFPIYFHEDCLQIWDAERIALHYSKTA